MIYLKRSQCIGVSQACDDGRTDLRDAFEFAKGFFGRTVGLTKPDTGKCRNSGGEDSL